MSGTQHGVGIAKMIVTCDQQEAAAIADRMAVMRRGLIVQGNIPANVYERPADAFAGPGRTAYS